MRSVRLNPERYFDVFILATLSRTQHAKFIFFVLHSCFFLQIIIPTHLLVMRKCCTNVAIFFFQFKFIYFTAMFTLQTRLTEHFAINNLLNPFQSAYIKDHSTETTLLSVMTTSSKL